MLIHHGTHFAYPGQVDLFYVVGIVTDDKERFGDTVFCNAIRKFAFIAIRVFEPHQHRPHYGVGLDTLFKKGELLFSRCGVTADACGGNQPLENKSILIRAHELDLLRRDIDEVGRSGCLQGDQDFMDLLDLVDKPILVDIAFFDP